MMSVINTCALWVTQFLLDVLPDTPFTGWFQDFAANAQALQTALAVLNFFVPIHEMWVLLTVWFAAVIAFYTKYFALTTFGRVVGGLSGALDLVGSTVTNVVGG